MASALDVTALERWLVGHVPGFRGPVQVERFAGGQSNPTFRLRAASGNYVLRKKPEGVLLPSAAIMNVNTRVRLAW